MSIQEVAARFNQLARQEKWFDIQDELFADNVRSVEPLRSPYMKYAEGKAAVRTKAEEFVKKVQDFHGAERRMAGSGQGEVNGGTEAIRVQCCESMRVRRNW
jgi:hypothetical protein